MINKLQKLICKKPYVDVKGNGVAKWAEYYVESMFEMEMIEGKFVNTSVNYRVFTEPYTNNEFFVGVFPIKNFISLAEFRNIRIDDILR